MFSDPLSVFRAVFAALTPGGYFEMQDPDFKPHSLDGTTTGTAVERWNTLVLSGAQNLGRDWRCARNYKSWFEEAGFEKVVERVECWPGNGWPKDKRLKEMGRRMHANTLEGIDPVSLVALTRGLGMSREDVRELVEEVRREFGDRRVHGFWPVYVVYGRKPL